MKLLFFALSVAAMSLVAGGCADSSDADDGVPRADGRDTVCSAPAQALRRPSRAAL